MFDDIYRNHKIRIAVGMTVLAILLFGGGAGAVPVEEWNKTFGGTGNDVAKSVQQTSDGGYIIGGYKFSSGKGYEAWLVKADANGNEQWNKTFDGTVTSGWAYYVQQTSDSGYIFLAAAGLLIKTDPNGNQQWNRTFGKRGSDEIRSVQQTTDGGYILAGKTNSYKSDGSVANDVEVIDPEDVWLIKIDQNGNQQWNNTFGRTYTGRVVQPPSTYVATSKDDSYSVKQTKDGGFILAAATQSTSGEALSLVDAVWIIKADADGKEQWNKILKGINVGGQVYAVQQTSDGGYIFAGGYKEDIFGQSGDAWFTKTDGNGNQQWIKTSGGIKTDLINSVQQTKDGGYVLAGYTESYGAGKYDAWLIKTDTKGDELWNRTFGRAGDDRAYAVQQTADNGYILAGSASSYGAGLTDAWLIKLSGEPSEATVVPTASPTPKAEITIVPTVTPTDTEKEEVTKAPTSAPKAKVSGFEVVLATVALSAVYIFRQRRKK